MKRALVYFLCGAFLCLAVWSCKPTAPAGLSEMDKTAIRKVVDQVMVIANAPTKDWAAYTRAYYAEDAVALDPNMPAIEGRAAIESLFLKFPSMTDFKVELVEIEGRGDLAYVRGKYSMMFTPPGASEPLKDTGKYIEIWRKQADGSWKVIRDIYNSDLPLPAPEKEEDEKEEKQ